MPTTRGADRGATPATVRLLVFSDLDGTLLRHEDYSWEPARPALAELARRRVPVVVASSKTRAEIEEWRARLALQSPFISENGGALYVPPGATPRPVAGASPAFGYLRVEFGAPYERLREVLGRLANAVAVGLRGFGDMSTLEVSQRTGLSVAEAALARQREYDEPFVPERELDAAEESRLAASAEALGLRVTRGGRFHHLIGPSSKGEAARRLIAAYTVPDGPPVLSIGLGDGANDLELLQVVDRPVVIARPDGTHASALREALPAAMFTTGIGPDGFGEAIIGLLG